MTTPIIDFVKQYEQKQAIRLHMPGHKGKAFVGYEKYDITEINGADSLFEACGIIKESEENASDIFGCHTFYSTEGSSLCMRAMLYLALAGKSNPLVLAGRNAHKTFLTSAVFLDFDIKWIAPKHTDTNYLSCSIEAYDVENEIKELYKIPDAVYITSPDYLGNMCDIKAISEVCKKYNIPLIVDNAHGSYLKFLTPSLHPIDLGADMCCDSAHKTLPALTGCAYLHVSKTADEYYKNNAKEALALFASTSPSYLLLQSFDAVNKYIFDGYMEKLREYVERVSFLKERLLENGYTLVGAEKLKITIDCKKYGYEGTKLSAILEETGIYAEFSDKDFIVFMLTPEIKELDIIKKVLLSIPKKDEIQTKPPCICMPQRVLSTREAQMSKKELINVDYAVGRILASPSVGCPPAVPIAVCGEVITDEIINCFKYYGIEKIYVIKNDL